MEKGKIEEYNEKTRVFRVMKEAIPYIVIIVVVVLIRTFIMTPVRVNGISMKPRLQEGDILILNKLHRSFDRFDIVVVNEGNAKLVKRIIGLPGESVEYIDCVLYINGVEVKENYKTECVVGRRPNFTLEETYGYLIIPKGYYFVMGDNRDSSSDSREPVIGLIAKSQLEGTAAIRIYPFNKIGGVK